MNNRYIQRFRLPERQYCAASPVVLAAGALLEDTKLPRLVAQLKFISLSEKSIAGLAVTIRCLDSDGAATGAIEYSYENLAVRRSRAFGQYKAIVLPVDGHHSFTATVNTVTFEDGGVWTAPEGALWESLPAFVPLGDALGDEGLLAISRARLPKGRFAYAAPCDLWYCTCGGVNNGAQATCHRCAEERNLVAKYAAAAQLAALRQTRLDEASRRAAEREKEKAIQEELRARAALAAAKEEATATAIKESADSAAVTEKVAAAPATAEESAAITVSESADVQPVEPAQEETLPQAPVAKKPKAGKKKFIIAAALALVVVSALALLLPRFIDGADLPDIGEIIVEPNKDKDGDKDLEDEYKALAESISVTTSGDTDETAYMDVSMSEDGRYTVTVEEMRKKFPELVSFSTCATPLGDDISDYIVDGFHMSSMVSSNGSEVGGNQYSSFSSKEGFFALLIYDDKTNLGAYSIGVPEDRGDDVFRLNFTICNYDFSSLLKEQSAAYYASSELPYIEPEDKDSCGAHWYLRAYNMAQNNEIARDGQMYHLLSRLNSPYLERFAGSMEDFVYPREDPETIRYTYYVLLDEEHEPIGYTMLTNGTSDGSDVRVTNSTDLGKTAFMDVTVSDNGRLFVSQEMIEESFPQARFFTTNTQVLGNDIDDYISAGFHMCTLVSHGSRQEGRDRYTFSSEAFIAVLIYDDETNLCGYAVGIPEERGGGVYRLNFTLCDYDFAGLFKKQSTAYHAAEAMDYIAVEDVSGSSAKWILSSRSFDEDTGTINHNRMYQLWNQLNSPYLKRYCKSIENLKTPSGDDTRYMYYLLLDKNYEPLGYTMLSNKPSSTSGKTGAETGDFVVTAPGDKGNAYLDLELGADGECQVTLEGVQVQFPKVKYVEFNGMNKMSLDIDDYLKDSYQMAYLIGSGGSAGGDDEGGSFSPLNDPDSLRALLLFDSETHLIGHAIGVPESLGNNVWRLNITLCDYDFTELYEQQSAAYYASEKLPYIAPGDIDGSGAKWYLDAYRMRGNSEKLGHVQMYHLWNQLKSPYTERHCRSMDVFYDRLPKADARSAHYPYFVLLDKDYEPIGYTMVPSDGSTTKPAV